MRTVIDSVTVASKHFSPSKALLDRCNAELLAEVSPVMDPHKASGV